MNPPRTGLTSVTRSNAGSPIASAISLVQIRSAFRTQAAAIRAAYIIQRLSRENRITNHIRNINGIPVKIIDGAFFLFAVLTEPEILRKTMVLFFCEMTKAPVTDKGLQTFYLPLQPILMSGIHDSALNLNRSVNGVLRLYHIQFLR